jgi:membrane-associated phospholipid phosphatase
VAPSPTLLGPDDRGAVPGTAAPREDPGRGPDLELVTAVVLLAVVAAVGAFLAGHPGPTIVDRLAADVVPGRRRAPDLAAVTRMGSPVVVVAGSLAACAAWWRRARARAVGVAVSPVLCVVACDWILKPAVSRHLDGVLTFPSGTVAAVAALATAAVLATPDSWRWVSAAVGATAVTLVGLSVVVLRWHYPTDAMAGAAMGVAVVLLADAVACRAAARTATGPRQSTVEGTEEGAPPAPAER